jgi:hypothetical protein
VSACRVRARPPADEPRSVHECGALSRTCVAAQLTPIAASEAPRGRSSPHRTGPERLMEFAAHKLLHSDAVLQRVLGLRPGLKVCARALEGEVAQVAAARNGWPLALVRLWERRLQRVLSEILRTAGNTQQVARGAANALPRCAVHTATLQCVRHPVDSETSYQRHRRAAA